jgi:eukaryotic-like serine/threonine-protein kinase
VALLESHEYAGAEPVLRACVAILDRPIPDEWRRFNALNLLGGALLGQGKHAEAEPLILQGYAGMQKSEPQMNVPGSPNENRLRAIGLVVQLYDATNRPDKAREWRAKLPPEVALPPRPRKGS